MLVCSFESLWTPFDFLNFWIFEFVCSWVRGTHYKRPDPRASPSHLWDAEHYTLTWCMTGRFSGCPDRHISSREPVKRFFGKEIWNVCTSVKLFTAFLLCVAKIMFVNGREKLRMRRTLGTFWFHKYSFFERARLLFSISAIVKQPTSLPKYQKNLKMHQNIVKIRKPVVTQFFWAKAIV